MPKQGFQWIVSPTQGMKLDPYEVVVNTYIAGVLNIYKRPMERYAQQNARWQNRTGDARRGLTAEVISLKKQSISLVFMQTVWYGVFLELRWSGRYAIVMQTLSRFWWDVWRDVKSVFRAR